MTLIDFLVIKGKTVAFSKKYFVAEHYVSLWLSLDSMGRGL